MLKAYCGSERLPFPKLLSFRFLLSTFAFLILTSRPVWSEEVWRIASLNWEPYAGEHLHEQGASIQALRALLQPHDIRLEVDFYPWRRAQMVAEGKDYIGYYPAWPAEVKEGFISSKAIDYSQLALVKQSGSEVHFSSLDNLFRDYRVGLVKTYAYPVQIAAIISRYPEHVVWAETERALIRKLSMGRHPVALTDPKVVHYQLNQEQLSNIELVAVLEQLPLVLALRNQQDNQARIRLLQQIIQGHR